MQDQVSRVVTTVLDEDYSGDATVEAYTVMHDHDGPEVGLCALRTPAGGRTWGRVTDPAAAAEMTRAEAIGSTGHLDADGVIYLSG